MLVRYCLVVFRIFRQLIFARWLFLRQLLYRGVNSVLYYGGIERNRCRKFVGVNPRLRVHCIPREFIFVNRTQSPLRIVSAPQLKWSIVTSSPDVEIALHSGTGKKTDAVLSWVIANVDFSLPAGIEMTPLNIIVCVDFLAGDRFIVLLKSLY